MSNVYDNANFYVRAGQAGPFPDDFPYQVRGDNNGAMVVQQLNGPYAEAVRRGNMYLCTVTTGAALLLSATTGNCPTIFNPSGSGIMVYPVDVTMSFLSGTTTIGAALWALTANAGSTFATGAPIPTFTNVAPRNALLGGGNVAKFLWAPAVCTFTAAPTVVAATGINLGAAAPTAGAPYTPFIDGKMAVMPGQALSLTYSVTTSTSLWFTTIWCVEVPLPSGM